MLLPATRTRFLFGALLILCAVGASGQSGSSAATGLSVLYPPELVDCGPITSTPCFSVTVTPSNAAGHPVPVKLPPKDQLLQALQVDPNGAAIAPFYVSLGSGSDSTQRSNVVLIELDISGSMNTLVGPGISRFDAAKSAIAKYLESMQQGVDQIAIVPFESHHVVPTIRAAVFTNKRDEAIAQLNAVPRPDAHNNTALFQAVFSGVDTMQAEMTTLVKPGITAADFEPRVIVMTDGKNEVFRGDDPDLLDGPLGMQQAAAKVVSSGLDVIGIGFGDRNEIDANALQRLSKRFYLAATGDELEQIFHATTPLTTSELQISFLSPWKDRTSLSSRDPQFVIALTLPDGRRLLSEPARYTSPAISAPLYTRHATAEEMQALIAARPTADSGWGAVLRGLLIFCSCGVLLILLWFWIPRLIWSGEFSPSYAESSRRWGKDAGVKASATQVMTVANTPDGFDLEHVRDRQQRSAEQTTQVHSRAALSEVEAMRDAR